MAETELPDIPEIPEIPEDIQEALVSGQPINEYLLFGLPVELQVAIVQQLAPSEILQLCLVSRQFNRIFCQKDTYQLWKYLYRRDISRVRLPIAPDTYRLAYQKIMKSLRNLNRIDGMYFAVDKGYERLLSNLIAAKRPSPDSLNGLLVKAATTNYFDIIEALLDWGATDIDSVLKVATQGGKLPLIKQLIYWAASNFEQSLADAPKIGSLDIVDYLLTNRATNVDYALKSPLLKYDPAIVRRRIQAGLTDLNIPFVSAAQFGDIDLIKQLIARNVDNPNLALDFDWALRNAAGVGNLDIVKLLATTGATDLNLALEVAVLSSRVAVADYLIRNGATNFNHPLIAAVQADNDNITLVEMLLAAGANNFQRALRVARELNKPDIGKLLLAAGANNIAVEDALYYIREFNIQI